MSIETLSYYLDCSQSAIRDYVKRGALPPPVMMGSLVRWYWDGVVAHLLRRGGPTAAHELRTAQEEDPYMRGAQRVTPEKANRLSA